MSSHLSVAKTSEPDDLDRLAGMVRDHLVRLGGCRPEAELTIPMLLMLLGDTADEFERMKFELARGEAQPETAELSPLASKCRERLIRWLVDDTLSTSDRASIAGMLRSGHPGFESLSNSDLIAIARETSVMERDGFNEVVAALVDADRE